VRIIQGSDFDSYWKKESGLTDDKKTEKIVRKIIDKVRADGDTAVRKFASKFDRSSPRQLEVPFSEAKQALRTLSEKEPVLVNAMKLAAKHIRSFSEKQKEQFANFEVETETGLVTGQRIIPVQRAAIYVPGGRFPLFSSVLMGMIPAICAGVEEVILSSPPAENGLPDKKILAAAAIAVETAEAAKAANAANVTEKKIRIFSMGGAQAIAALALGTQSVLRVDVIAGPGNKFVAAAKRILFGEVGIDFIAGPTDVLVLAECNLNDNAGMEKAADLIAADMLAQAEHDIDARARALVNSGEFADKITEAVEKRLKILPAEKTARASINAGGLIVIFKNKEEAIRIANTIAPEHLELQTDDVNTFIPLLKNYGSLFIGSLSAEVLGDYSAGINHTLPTKGSARFTGGLSVRHFLKTVTTLRCSEGEGYEKARNAAEILARAEGLEGHALSAAERGKSNFSQRHEDTKL
jgi:histidinol dehydrogenase